MACDSEQLGGEGEKEGETGEGNGRKGREETGGKDTGALCMQHSPTDALLLTSFHLNHTPTVPIAERIDTRLRESYSSVSMS